MSPPNALVSTIIPVHNGAAFLVEALNSVLRQPYQPLEIIVVDDGSVDGTAAIAAQFRRDVRYVYQVNRGPAAARNAGIHLAAGDYFAFLDVDDLWTRNRLSPLVDVLLAHPGVDIVQGLIQDSQVAGTARSTPGFRPHSEPYFSVNLGSALYRRRVFEKVGLFDEALRYNEDTDWFIRAWENDVSKKRLSEVVLLYRRHDGNMTNRDDSMRSGFVRVLKKHLDQQRKASAPGQTASRRHESVTEYIGWKA
jgi:glycosyltransferase involved in cell wall biosynthesis